MSKFEFSGRVIDDEDMAQELERIADMIREGFTSGETSGGWWSVDVQPCDDAEGSDDD